MLEQVSISSLALFVVFAITAGVFIAKTKNYKRIKYILIAYLLGLSFLSYSYKPLMPVDLTRLQSTLDSYTNVSFNDMATSLLHTSDFTRVAYFWIIAKIGDYNLLQTLAVLIFYACTFYILYDYCKRNDISSRTMGIALIIYMMLGQFIFVASGVRTAIAFAIFAFCSYREICKEKSLLYNIPLYFVAIGMHTAVLPAILLRIIFLLFEKQNKGKHFFQILLVITTCLIVSTYNNEILQTMIDKTNEYVNVITYSNKAEYLATFLEFIALCSMMIMSSSAITKSKHDNSIKSYRSMVSLFCVLCIIFSFQYTIFSRYVRLTEILMIPISVNLFYWMQKNGKQKRIYPVYNAILIIILICIFTVEFFAANMSTFNLFGESIGY